jgi:hypothetical protein
MRKLLIIWQTFQLALPGASTSLAIYVSIFKVYRRDLSDTYDLSTAGSEAEKKYPDFMAVKVKSLRGPNEAHKYYIVSFVEIKRSNQNFTQAVGQVIGYMKQLINHPSREKNLVGFLVGGRTAQAFTLEQDQRSKQWRVNHQAEAFDLFEPLNGSDSLTMTLCRICCRNWN